MATRVEQADWEAPSLAAWSQGLDAALAQHSQPVVLVAHSLGCILAVHWCAAHPQRAKQQIKALILVAPADADSAQHTPECVRGFSPIPRAALPAPAVVIASQTDPYCAFDRARQLAADWNAELVDLGDAGHINVSAGYGAWPWIEDTVQRYSSL